MDLDKLNPASCPKCYANVFQLLKIPNWHGRPRVKCVECGTIHSGHPKKATKVFVKIWVKERDK